MNTALSTATITTKAAIAANRMAAANLAALGGIEPNLAAQLRETTIAGEWVFGRDGSICLLDEKGQFANDCTIPRRAAERMLRSFVPAGTTPCFLLPERAAEVRVALNKLSEEQALIAIQPSLRQLREMLAGDDFTRELHAGRLFFVSGDAWADDLSALFRANPGLPTPTQFVKLPTLSGEMQDALINTATPVFSNILAARADEIGRLRSRSARPGTRIKRIGVLAKSRFALWDDAGHALASALLPGFPAVDVLRLAIDRPRSAGPVATAQFAAQCDAIVMADCARSDFPGVLPMKLPWVTWITTGRVPAAVGDATGDALLIADEAFRATALAAGWPGDRIHLAESSADEEPIDARAADAWTVIADTSPLDTPEALDRFSSHRLLWEKIAGDLVADPFALSDDANAYLDAAAKSAGVDPSQIDRSMFLNQLILPAFEQGAVRSLVHAGVAVRAFGAGWAELAIPGVTAGGSVQERDEFALAVRSSRRLLHVWPNRAPHPIDRLGRPVVRVPGSAAEYAQLVRQPTVARAAAARCPIDLGVVLQAIGA